MAMHGFISLGSDLYLESEIQKRAVKLFKASKALSISTEIIHIGTFLFFYLKEKLRLISLNWME